MMIVKDMAATAIVAASTATRGIGFKGDLPWKLPGDMQHFKTVTMGNGGSGSGDDVKDVNSGKVNAVVMGRKTWESIPTKFRPLQGRTNVVLTSGKRSDGDGNSKGNGNTTTTTDPTATTTASQSSSSSQSYPEGVITASSLQDAWQQLATLDNLGQIFIIGGSQLYEQAVAQNYVHTIIYTSVDAPLDMEFDAYFPELGEDEWTCQNGVCETATTTTTTDKDTQQVPPQQQVQVQPQQGLHTDPKSGWTYKFLTYTRQNKQEQQYLDLIASILKHGIPRGDRTGTGTLSQFGAQMRFSLRDHQLPLLTTKRTFWRGVAEELLWFISGSTNANILAQEKNVHIWDGNGSTEFLQARGLGHREPGDLGPVYGFQWRHFGAKYQDMHTDYTGQGVDQLKDCIHKIIHNPEDRRIVMSAWNPADLDDMALPPCHMFCQFYVDTHKNELSCQMYQRSADMGLGVPFNIASYALLTHMMAHVTGLKAGDLVHTIGDAHVYLNHVQPLQEQLKRTPRPFPKIYINPEKKKGADIDSFEFSDFNVIGYHPMKTIKMEMAV
jgi:dihydrofolate reductase/thymidylate synthase